MEYSNPKIPEGINASQKNPLKEFVVLTIGVLGVVAIIVTILSVAAEKLAPFIPFSTEQGLVKKYQGLFPDNDEITPYLQNLAEKLSASMQLPDDMKVIVHYSDKDTVNAYATLGGHIVIFRGLIDKLPHENALAMVLAHEIAHVYHRHPIIATGRGLVVGLALAGFAGLSGNDLFSGVISDTSLLTVMTFSRSQERQADRTGIDAVAKYYGHVAGADELFRTLIKLQADQMVAVPGFMSSHPLSQDRIDELNRYAKKNSWKLSGKKVPLPSILAKRLDS